MATSRDTTMVATVAFLVGSGLWWYCSYSTITASTDADDDENDFSVLPCIRNRRSIFPKEYLQNPPSLDNKIIQSLLDAAIWGPYHGKCYSGNQHPAKFVILKKQSMIEMQNLSLEYYDKNWKEVGWGCHGGACSNKQQEYDAWRKMTYDEINGRWGPCHAMLAIIMRRQTGPKRLPEWEETAAVCAAVQNMHIQASTKFPQLACYWSSWHDAARDSNEMKFFLGMDKEDKCLGFFIIAHKQKKSQSNKDRRTRDKSLIEVEWRA